MSRDLAALPDPRALVGAEPARLQPAQRKDGPAPPEEARRRPPSVDDRDRRRRSLRRAGAASPDAGPGAWDGGVRTTRVVDDPAVGNPSAASPWPPAPATLGPAGWPGPSAHPQGPAASHSTRACEGRGDGGGEGVGRTDGPEAGARRRPRSSGFRMTTAAADSRFLLFQRLDATVLLKWPRVPERWRSSTPTGSQTRSPSLPNPALPKRLYITVASITEDYRIQLQMTLRNLQNRSRYLAVRAPKSLSQSLKVRRRVRVQ